jgi:hypothetical protein
VLISTVGLNLLSWVCDGSSNSSLYLKLLSRRHKKRATKAALSEIEISLGLFEF